MTTTPPAHPCTGGHDLVRVFPPDTPDHVAVYGCRRCGYGLTETTVIDVAIPVVAVAVVGWLVVLAGLLVGALTPHPLDGRALLAVVLIVIGAAVAIPSSRRALR
jgi:uncharacterized protein (DUF983 family)